jgi:iron(III) transport system ATP-binding protein
MRDGHIVQTGRPADVYAEPVDPWVADFVGEAVWLPAVVTGGHADTPLGVVPVVGTPGGTRVLVRPEQIDLTEPATANGAVAVVDPADGTDAVVAPADGARAVVAPADGARALLGLRLADGTEVAARVLGPAGQRVGTHVHVRVHGSARSYGPS